MPVLSLIAAALAAELPNLAWLEGDWCTAPAPDGARSCEQWGPARGGTMRGTSRTIRDGGARHTESLRIELVAETAVLYATPRGGPTTLFRQATREARGISFANPAHDYPQRIRYWRRGAELVAEIAMADGSRPRRWVYARMP
ncbi:DUF6265 family protein [Sphingomonas sp.]|uniref:DUF6265 family protein n=1 Tax=Sphingomonas sp. TaxID=28214 RepID=UPI001EC6DE45|nr:DUF6265 family protein [Sphingomonas sp.]MBX3593184.1 hypothetical protein [Sphingomonas sp.]